MPPAVTIVVPAYNVENFIQQTLDSISAQTLKNFQCIIIDDCSIDNTAAIIKRHREKDKRFQIIRHKVNAGQPVARNTGIRAAAAPYIAFLDADDLIMAKSLEVRLKAIESDLAVDKCAGSYAASVTINEDTKIPPATKPANLSRVDFISAMGRCPFNANQPMIKASILRELGGFNEVMKQAEDYDLWMRILRAGYHFAAAPYKCVTYRKRSKSVVRAAPLEHLQNSNDLLKSAYTALPEGLLFSNPNVFSKALPEYLIQSHSLSRTTEFIGMDLAAGTTSPSKLADYMSKALPDLNLLLRGNNTLEKLLNRGFLRYGQATPYLEDRSIEFIRKIDEATVENNKKKRKPSLSRTNFPYQDSSKNKIWNRCEQEDVDIIFLPHKGYHVWTIALAKKSLNAARIKFQCVDLSTNCGDNGSRQVASEHGLSLIGMSEFILGAYKPRLIVVFNDWDASTRPIILAAKKAGIATASIVEGIQDYHDVDTRRIRQPYQASDVILLPGVFDQRYFPNDRKTHVVGVHRIHELYAKETTSPIKKSGRPIALINSNFSYNVLTEHRDAWIEEAVNSAIEAGFSPCISRHPNDVGETHQELVDSRDFYTLLEESTVTIQRFASGILESIARRRPVYYFNPHGEKIDKFIEPQGAYPIITHGERLVTELKRYPHWEREVRKKGLNFLNAHAGEMKKDSGLLTANALKAAFGNKPDDKTLMKFNRLMKEIDRKTSGLTSRKNLFWDLNEIEVEKIWSSLYKIDANTPVKAEYIKVKKHAPKPNTTLLKARKLLHSGLVFIYKKTISIPYLGKLVKKIALQYDKYLKP